MLPQLLRASVDIIYPPICVICKDKLNHSLDRAGVCQSCLEKLPKNTPPFCQRCGISLREAQIQSDTCSFCKKRDFFFARAWSICLYSDEMIELIRLFKYKARLSLREIFARLLCEFIDTYHLPINEYHYLVPIPLHPARLREREFNQAEILAQDLASRFKVKINLNNLIRTKNSKSQTQLSQRHRFENIQGAFRVRRPEEFSRKSILLIDDLFTTGATVNEAAGVLRNAGADLVDVLTLARA